MNSHANPCTSHLGFGLGYDYWASRRASLDKGADTKTGVLEFEIGQSSDVFTVNITDDRFIEPNLTEVFEVKLLAPSAGAGYELSTGASQTSVAVEILDGVCNRQAHVCYELIKAVPGDEECWEVTEEHLAALRGTLDVSDSRIGDGELRRGDFRNLPELTRLDLSGNELTNLPSLSLEPLTSLEEMDLSDNDFSSLNDSFFEGVTTLRSLDMSGNPGTGTETEDGEQVSYVELDADVVLGSAAQFARVQILEGAPFPVQVTLSASPEGAKLWDSGVETYSVTVPAGGLVSDELLVTGVINTTVTVSVVSAEFVDPGADPTTWEDRHKGIKPVPGASLDIEIPPPTVTIMSSKTVGMEGETLILVAELNVLVDPHLDVPVTFSTNSSEKGAGPEDYTVQSLVIDETPLTAFRFESGSKRSELSVLLVNDDVLTAVTNGSSRR